MYCLLWWVGVKQKMLHALEPQEQAVCCDLLLWSLRDPNVGDIVEQHGIELLGLRSRLVEASEQFVDHEAIVFDEHQASEYEDTKKRARPTQKEKIHDVAALLTCYGKRTLTGMQVQEALLECSKETVVQFVMTQIAGWKPPQTRKRYPAVAV